MISGIRQTPNPVTSLAMQSKGFGENVLRWGLKCFETKIAKIDSATPHFERACLLELFFVFLFNYKQLFISCKCSNPPSFMCAVQSFVFL